MSHGASACFSDVIDPTNVCQVYPDLEPLFKEVIDHEVWGLLEYTQNCNFSDREMITTELRDIVAMNEEEAKNDYQFVERTKRMATSFHRAFRKLKIAFRKKTGAEIDTMYIDPDSLDCYADVRGRHWYIYNQHQLIPKTRQAVKKGLVITRSFYAVYG